MYVKTDNPEKKYEIFYIMSINPVSLCQDIVLMVYIIPIFNKSNLTPTPFSSHKWIVLYSMVVKCNVSQVKSSGRRLNTFMKITQIPKLFDYFKLHKNTKTRKTSSAIFLKFFHYLSVIKFRNQVAVLNVYFTVG